METILKARGGGGRFGSLADLCERADSRAVNRKVLEALIKCGACDGFGRTRATLFAQMDRTLARAAGIIADRGARAEPRSARSRRTLRRSRNPPASA